MRWRKGLRNGDRENGGAWRGGWVEGEGIRDKRWNRLERRREGESGCDLGYTRRKKYEETDKK